jgi:hypothetical protein
MQIRQESSGRLHLVSHPNANAIRDLVPFAIEPLSRTSTRTPTHAQVPDLIRRLDYVIATLVALLCSYWILQGLW